jgi:AcrR family transcriptional regulator
MANDTQQHIFEAAKRIFAERGYDGLSMRTLAKEAKISLSVIYHHYPDKDVLLQHIFDTTNTQLGLERKKLKPAATMSDSLLQRVEFQFKHIEEVVFVLKYFLHYRSDFQKNPTGWVPEKTSLHIEEVLRQGKSSGELREDIDVVQEAKIITHAINGFLLEYFPAQPRGQEKRELIRHLHAFILRSIAKPNSMGVPMP